MSEIEISDSESETSNDETIKTSFLIKKLTDLLAVRVKAPAAELMWQVTLIPASEAERKKRSDWLDCAQVVFNLPINYSDTLYEKVNEITERISNYVQSHPESRTSYYNPDMDVHRNALRLFRSNDNFRFSNDGVPSHIFKRSEEECSWISAPPPDADLVLEMALHPFNSVAGVAFNNRYERAILHMCHTLTSNGPVYQILLPIIKKVHSDIINTRGFKRTTCFWDLKHFL